MKVRAIRNYVDKNTLQDVNKGEEFTVSKKRFEEINSTFYGPFVEEVDEKSKAEKEAKNKELEKPDGEEKPESEDKQEDSENKKDGEADPKGEEQPEKEDATDDKKEN